MSVALNTQRTQLQKRANALQDVRDFFTQREYIEVDPPALSHHCNIDAFIHPYRVEETGQYLFTSPEHFMKHTLSLGSGPIFFLGHVYRKEEVGSLHSPEFTMIEWYRPNCTEKLFLQETCDLLSIFLGKQELEILSYTDAYQKYAKTKTAWDEETNRHYVWGVDVEPQLGQKGLTVITPCLADDAQQAQIELDENNQPIARRYEFYYRGIELANGYLECSNCKEIKKRFTIANNKRAAYGTPTLPIDPLLLSALERGLPPNTYGIAAGFDRLLMLKENQDNIKSVLFPCGP